MNSVSLANDSSRSLFLAGSLFLICLSTFVFLFWSRNAAMVELVYPIAMVVVAGTLYITRPAIFLGFCWWIWFITPFVRRVVGYQTGVYDATSAIMLTPYLVTALSLITFVRLGKQLLHARYFPFLLSILGIVYGFLVGVVEAGVFSAMFGVLQWLMPVMMGLHVLLLWQDYPEHRRVIRETFTWGILLMGLYGIYQFINPPPWDAHWLTYSGMTSSMGQPEPYSIRIFSTLNSTGPFAIMTMVGLVLLFDGRGFMAPVAAIPGYISLLLTLVRAAWGGWLIALAFLALRVRGSARSRLFVFLLVGVGLSVPLVLINAPMSERVTNRMGTVGNIGEDGSFQARLDLYARASPRIATSLIGEGIGSYGTAAKLSTGSAVNFDSGVLQIPITLGWLGTFLYIGGLAIMVSRVWRIREEDTDRFAVIVTGVVLALLVLLIFQNQLIGTSGMVTWIFLGLALAAEAYYAQQ
ncbi:MAG TPA: O-antigen ligase family protein [Rhodothermales bacterium]|nr:O-antigen ligase family protein [Rhodothermales bacterium]